MNLESYIYLASNDFKSYSFYSDGPKGRIKKTVIYSKIQEEPIIYNLAFGDEDPITGEVSDKVKSNNEDRDIVLATVASTIHTFSEHNSYYYIYAKGSSPARTRLYQMSIAKIIHEIRIDFDVLGVIDNETFPFETNVNYDAFLIKKK